jgi:hypothetical protein
MGQVSGKGHLPIDGQVRRCRAGVLLVSLLEA